MKKYMKAIENQVCSDPSFYNVFTNQFGHDCEIWYQKKTGWRVRLNKKGFWKKLNVIEVDAWIKNNEINEEYVRLSLLNNLAVYSYWLLNHYDGDDLELELARITKLIGKDRVEAEKENWEQFKKELIATIKKVQFKKWQTDIN